MEEEEEGEAQGTRSSTTRIPMGAVRSVRNARYPERQLQHNHVVTRFLDSPKSSSTLSSK